MTGKQLQEFRKSKDWTQSKTANRLGVTQGYWSQLERDQRKLSGGLQRKLASLGGLSPLSLPLVSAERWQNVNDANESFAKALGHLGYPGFSYYRGRSTLNPAEVLVGALVQPNLETRLAEAMPWLATKYANMDWHWAVREAKVNDAQNRLGFVLTLARQLADRKGLFEAAGTLNAVEKQLEHARLEREDTLCNDALTGVERRWLSEYRPPEAAKWHLLTDLTADRLPYAP